MAGFGTEIILDGAGEPIGAYRDNQSPDDVQRFHPVPRVNAKGDPILDGNGDPETTMVSLDDPRTVAQLAVEGLVVDGNVIVAAEPVG